MKDKIKDLFSTKYAPIRQFRFIEGIAVGLYVASIMVSLEVLEAILKAYPQYLPIQFKDGTSLPNQILINKLFIVVFITMLILIIYQNHLKKRDKNNKNIKETMKTSIWRKIWESEDSHLFGELFIIIATIFLSQSLSNLFPNLSKWLFLGLSFLLLWWGIKLIRKSKNK